MIYTVISRTDILSKYYETRDCSAEQPLNLSKEKKNNFYISEDIIEYIENTKNIKTRHERISAYTSLFFTLFSLFNIIPERIMRSELKKPYIEEGVYFSISHSDELTAVTLSSDKEVGVDIQEIITNRNCKKIEDRFLKDFEYNETDIEISYYTIDVDKNGNLVLIPLFLFLNNIDKLENDIYLLDGGISSNYHEYTKKWTAAEAMSKLSGGGLSDFPIINDISNRCACRIDTICFRNRHYVLSNAVYKL